MLLGMDVVGYDPTISVDEAWRLPHSLRRVDSLQKAAAVADFLTVHEQARHATAHATVHPTVHATVHPSGWPTASPARVGGRCRCTGASVGLDTRVTQATLQRAQFCARRRGGRVGGGRRGAACAVRPGRR